VHRGIRHRRVIALLALAAAGVGPAAPSVLAVPSQFATVTTTVRTHAGTAVTSTYVGTFVHPSVVVSGPAGTPTGTITIRLWKTSSTCSGSGPQAWQATLVDGAVDLVSLEDTSMTATSWSYQAQYNGNGTYFLTVGP
jgi:hypothetical protein